MGSRIKITAHVFKESSFWDESVDAWWVKYPKAKAAGLYLQSWAVVVPEDDEEIEEHNLVVSIRKDHPEGCYIGVQYQTIEE